MPTWRAFGSFHKRGMHSPVCPYLPRMSLDVMNRLMGATDIGLMTITSIIYQMYCSLSPSP